MKRITLYMAIIAMLVLSCNTGGAKKDKIPVAAMQLETISPDKPEGQNTTDSTRAAGNFEQAVLKNASTHADWNKKIIKTAEVRLELKDYTAYNQTLHKGLKDFSAYIAAEEQHLTDDGSTNQLTIKVPVDQFENLMNSFTGDGIKVLEKKISSEDVTGEMVDTRSRMEAKKQTRERYLELMRQAKNMKEILEVQQEINSIQEQIESASGRVNYLGHQSAYSTVHLYYFQYTGPQNKVKDGPGYAFRIRESFYIGIRMIANLFIIIVTLWPLILGVIIAVLIWKRNKIKIMKQ